MVKYENYQQLRSWLKKVKDIDTVKKLTKNQGNKNRVGNKFAVIGANGYIGWALICQLVYKFPNCEIIAVDKNINAGKSITKNYSLDLKFKCLKKYFDFNYEIFHYDMKDYEICYSIINKTKPDFIVNLVNETSILTNLMSLNKSHLIMFTDYNTCDDNIVNISKITNFKISDVVGTCNFITLIDPILSTINNPDKLLNYIISKFKEKSIMNNCYITMISLEDITRAVVKIIRKGQQQKYKQYFAVDKIMSLEQICNIVSLSFGKTSIDLQGVLQEPPKLKDKRQFVKLIDKHRPPVEYMISYSCKNFLDTRGN